MAKQFVNRVLFLAILLTASCAGQEMSSGDRGSISTLAAPANIDASSTTIAAPAATGTVPTTTAGTTTLSDSNSIASNPNSVPGEIPPRAFVTPGKYYFYGYVETRHRSADSGPDPQYHVLVVNASSNANFCEDLAANTVVEKATDTFIAIPLQAMEAIDANCRVQQNIYAKVLSVREGVYCGLPSQDDGSYADLKFPDHVIVAAQTATRGPVAFSFQHTETAAVGSTSKTSSAATTTVKGAANYCASIPNFIQILQTADATRPVFQCAP